MLKREFRQQRAQQKFQKERSLQKIRKLNHIYSCSLAHVSYPSNIKYDEINNIKKINNKNILYNNTNLQKKYGIPFTHRLSDYNSWIKKIQKGKNNLPSIFKLIQLKKISNNKNNLITIYQNSYEYHNFRILSHTIQELIQISTEIVEKFGLASICGRYQLTKLIREISIGYNIVAYHNFSHGFSLMHMFYQLLKFDKRFKEMYTDQEIGFTLIAGLAHDMDHRGTNNIYEIKMKTELSKLANKQSILEKMHIRKFFNIIRSKNINILANTKNYQKIKQLIIKVILATDISKHFKGIDKLKIIKQKDCQNINNQQHRFFILEQVFHACDIGNACLEFDNYLDWAILLSYQFNNQTKLQQANNIEVSQMLKYKGKKKFFQGQQWFINMMVFPLWSQLSIVFKGFDPFVKQINKNIQKLKIVIKQEDLSQQCEK